MLRKLIGVALMATAMTASSPALAFGGMRWLNSPRFICFAEKGSWSHGDCWFRIY